MLKKMAAYGMKFYSYVFIQFISFSSILHASHENV